MNTVDYLLGFFLGVIAAVANCLGVLLFRRKGGWLLSHLPLLLLFIPPLMVVAVVFLIGSRTGVYFTGCIIGGSGLGYSIAYLRKAIKA